MCGIVGYIGFRQAAPILLEGLSRLQYRGYDSAGLAVHDNKTIHVRRTLGNISRLTQIVADQPIVGHLGIGHTRWATHGQASEENAHPHVAGKVAMVHNGILENHAQLKCELEKQGRHFTSQTDTEVLAHLVDKELVSDNDLERALVRALKLVKGTYALAVIAMDEPNHIVVARRASPLVIGVGDSENLVASDIPAILSYTRDLIFLEDGDLASVSAQKIRIYTFNNKDVQHDVQHIQWNESCAEKGIYKHFMHKEIHEQPRAIADTLTDRISSDHTDVHLDSISLHTREYRNMQRVVLVGCGTSWHAALVGKFLIESLARIHVDAELASEFRYGSLLLGEHDLMVAISQSGETADTLAAVKEAKCRNIRVLSICNSLQSSIARAANDVLYTRAGLEVGVASTKTFSAQIAVLFLLAVRAGRARGVLTSFQAREQLDALISTPKYIERVLQCEKHVEQIARTLVSSQNLLYIARGINYPIALEGALKLKEISYIHAEGYAAGEIKHGPISLIDEHMPVVAVATRNTNYEKILANLAEVRARNGRVIALHSPQDHRINSVSQNAIVVPSVLLTVEPMINIVPLQLLAYHVANFKGTDVDQPRNLAKSVTVE